MAKITPTHPQMVAEYQEEIMQSLDDSDVSIRMRALELVTSMVGTFSTLMCRKLNLRLTGKAYNPSWTSYLHTWLQPNLRAPSSLRQRHHLLRPPLVLLRTRQQRLPSYPLPRHIASP